MIAFLIICLLDRTGSFFHSILINLLTFKKKITQFMRMWSYLSLHLSLYFWNRNFFLFVDLTPIINLQAFGLSRKHLGKDKNKAHLGGRDQGCLGSRIMVSAHGFMHFSSDQRRQREILSSCHTIMVPYLIENHKSELTDFWGCTDFE
mgnify:CR=1 FL=1